MQHTDAMVAFYRSLGFEVAENPHVVSVYVGDQMINLHRPGTWQREGFTLRGTRRRGRRAATSASCGRGRPSRCTRCSVKAASRSSRDPVDREGGRRAAASSVYVRDPDGNLLEFMIYRREEV